MIHFLAGLPRSGSTLLCNILSQHPELQVTATSPLVNVVDTIRDNWRGLHRAVPEQGSDERLFRCLAGAMEGYHGDNTIIDKSRGWLSSIETIESALGRQAKVITTTRNLPDVVASFEILWRKNLAAGRVPAVLRADPAMGSVEGRVHRWLGQGDVIGAPLASLVDVRRKGLADRLHIVDYDELTREPGPVLQGIMEFLEIPTHEFDFGNVEQTTKEDDEVHGYTTLHDIRPQVAPQKSRAVDALGLPIVRKLAAASGWWDAVSAEDRLAALGVTTT